MLNLLAQVDETAPSDAAAAAVGVGILGAFAIFWIIIGAIYLAFFIWWIVLLVDAIKRDFPERTTWIVVLVIGWLIGLVWLVDLLYYFMVVKKYRQKGGSSGSAPAAPAAPTGTPPPAS